jgi:hypothetical protein
VHWGVQSADATESAAHPAPDQALPPIDATSLRPPSLAHARHVPRAPRAPGDGAAVRRRADDKVVGRFPRWREYMAPREAMRSARKCRQNPALQLQLGV